MPLTILALSSSYLALVGHSHHIRVSQGSDCATVKLQNCLQRVWMGMLERGQ
jgi:hypothetical protein